MIHVLYEIINVKLINYLPLLPGRGAAGQNGGRHVPAMSGVQPALRHGPPGHRADRQGERKGEKKAVSSSCAVLPVQCAYSLMMRLTLEASVQLA